ncbi:hypothetical protein GS529_08295 [Saccharibacter sp. EH70]|nr:hypothetical protein [Saccharibacter sp. EH70]
MSKARPETPQMRRTEYLKAAMDCLKKGQKTAAEALFSCAVFENVKAWGF